MKRTSLDDLYLFHSVAKYNSISDASKHLSVSIATISRRLIALEEELNLKLFNRTRRNLTLTNDGQTYYQQLHEIFDRLDTEVELLRYKNSSPVGHLKIGLPSFIYEYILSDAIHHFHESYPKIKLTISPVYDRNIDIDDEIDIAFRLHKPESPDLVSKRILFLEQVLVAATPSEQSFSDYSELKQWLDSKQLISHLEDAKIDLMDPGKKTWHTYNSKNQRLTLTMGSMILRNLSQSDTIALLPKAMVEQQLNDNKLFDVAKDWDKPILPINMIYRSRKNLPSAHRLFIDMISNYFTH
ncbi:LysR family transcriptional regulator [Vibrio inusitatus NBRC 102082]|uniref:LysR family transcriptional regulator n=1 Tax=Vibrio inusitatus NBRC 102082 TaxID=1219070 RepID=A0A4Y3HXC6_9VIBR|nr:LysR family transcriptional regulator [Vibrio inusitatus]GEA51829.1 LysR family transcriptional regulator [Vibrio inusitatus NBRC 102082]